MTDAADDYRVNWGEAFDFMHAVEDQVIKNLLGLVYDAVVRNDIEGERPAAPFDLLFCFRTLARAFSSKPEMWFAIREDVPNLACEKPVQTKPVFPSA